jgi:integrase
LVAERLEPYTVNKYVGYIKQVVKSKLAPNGEPMYPRTWNAEVLDLPIVIYRKQKRPALMVDGINALIAAKPGQERILYILLAATGLRISEALALEARHFIHDGRTILVEQQVDKDCPRIVHYVKTDASYREIDLHTEITKYIYTYVINKTGLIFHTSRNTPHLYHNLETRWLTPRLTTLGLDEEGMGWHAFRRYRNTWLKKQRVQEDHRLHWMAHKPKEMGEVYSALREDLPARLAEAERVGYGFSLPKEDVPNVPKKRQRRNNQKVLATGILVNRMKETRGV